MGPAMHKYRADGAEDASERSSVWDAVGPQGIRIADLLDDGDADDDDGDVVRRLREALLRADKSGDGMLGRQEMRAALVHAFSPKPLDAADLDTEDEFWALFPMGLPVMSLTGHSGALAKVGEFLAAADNNLNGHLDKAEFHAALQEAVSPAPLDSSDKQNEERLWHLFPMGLPVAALLGTEDADAAALADSLKKYDDNGNGFLDREEFRNALMSEIRMRQKVAHMKKIIIGLVTVIFVLVALITATTFVVVDSAKDTEASGGTLADRATGAPLRVGSDGFSVQADGSVRVGNDASDGSAKALAFARTHVAGAVNSSLSNEAYADLIGISAEAPGGAYVELDVMGFARVEETKVVLVTQGGFVTLDGPDIYFEDTIGDLFSQAGFDIADAPPPAPPPGTAQLDNIGAAEAELARAAGGTNGAKALRRLMTEGGVKLSGSYNKGGMS